MNKELKLYIVRHGQTEWNVLEKFQGQLNSPLTERGIEKVGKIGKELENVKFEAVYTSELGRTIGTAEIILEKNNFEKKKNIEKRLKLKKLPELNEIYFGEWQGMDFKEIFLKYPEEAHNYFYNVKNYCAKNVKGEELKVNYIENKEADDLDERKLIGNGEYRIFTYKNGKYLMETLGKKL